MLALTTLLFGGLLSKRLIHPLTVSTGFLVTGLACAYKLSTLCKVCGETSGQSFWFSLAGLFASLSFSALFTGAINKRQAIIAFGYSISVATYQAVAWVIEPWTDCLACTVILIANLITMTMVATIANLPEEAVVSTRAAPGRRITYGAGLACLLVMVALRAQPTQQSRLLGGISTKPTISLVGQRVSGVNLPKSPSQLVLVTLDGCEPCHSARNYLLEKGYSWVQVVTLDQLAGMDSAPKSVPTLLVLNERKIVTTEINGWADDPLWLKAFDYQILNIKPNRLGEKVP
jgi:hypothetical protein